MKTYKRYNRCFMMWSMILTFQLPNFLGLPLGCLVGVVHSQTWRVTLGVPHFIAAQVPNIWLTPELAGHIQEQRVPTGQTFRDSGRLWGPEFLLMIGTHQVASQVKNVKQSLNEGTVASNISGISFSAAQRKSSEYSNLFRAKHPSGAEQVS